MCAVFQVGKTEGVKQTAKHPSKTTSAATMPIESCTYLATRNTGSNLIMGRPKLGPLAGKNMPQPQHIKQNAFGLVPPKKWDLAHLRHAF